jgi:hypothetical protein
MKSSVKSLWERFGGPPSLFDVVAEHELFQLWQ